MKGKHTVQFTLASGKKYPAYVTSKGLKQYKKSKVVEADEFLGWKY